MEMLLALLVFLGAFALILVCCSPALFVIWVIGLAPGARVLPSWCYPKRKPLG